MPLPRTGFATLTLFLALNVPAFAIAPANDNFDDATDLGTTASATAAGSNIDSTEEFGEPNPSENPDVEPFSTVWWKFQVPADGFVEVSTAGSDFDTVLGVFTGTGLFTLIEVGSDNDSGAGLTSKVTIPVVTGASYHIQISGFAAEQGTIALSISPAAGPTPPVLNSITLLPSPVDVTAASGTVTASLQIDSPDGVDYGEIGVRDPFGNDTGAGGFFDESARVAGDEFSGTYEVPLAISTYSPPGTYDADLMLLELNGDSAAYGAGPRSWPGGASGTFEVVNGGTVDATPPAITSFGFTPNSVDVTAAAATLAVTVAATDDLGVQYLVIDVYDPDDFYLFGALATLSAGSITDGTWSASIPVARGSIPGSWRLDARAIDFSGKLDNFEPTATEDQFTVTNSGATDEDPPALVDLTFSPNPVVRGNPVTVTIDFADDLSGLAALPTNLHLDFYDEGGNLQFADPFSLADLSAGNSIAGTLQYPTMIQAGAPAGVWDTEIALQDGAGNRAAYGNFNPGGGALPYPSGVTGQLTVVETSGTAYALWIARYPSLVGADADPLADPDGDGWKNLLELVFDGDPTLALGGDPNAANFPVALMTATDFKLQFLLATANLTGTEGAPITVKGMASPDLASRSEVPLTDLGGGLYEVSVPLGSSLREFLYIDVIDPN